MKQCWKCRSTTQPTGLHHINKNTSDNRAINLVRLCRTCHDQVQGICDECANQPYCYVTRLKECWLFEKALPPIHFQRIGATTKEETEDNLLEVLGKGSNSGKTEKPNNSVTQAEYNPLAGVKNHCGVCGRPIKDNVRMDVEVVCGTCVQGLCQEPRVDLHETVRARCKVDCDSSMFCQVIGKSVSYCHRRDWK